MNGLEENWTNITPTGSDSKYCIFCLVGQEACYYVGKYTVQEEMRRGCGLAQSGEHVALDLRMVSLSPMLSTEIT